MASSALPENPPQLARFAPDVREAFARYRSTRDTAAAQIVVGAALVDFMPTTSAHARTGVPADSLRLAEDLGYDSLAIAEIVFFLEDLFGVKIETRDLHGIGTVGQLRGFVSERIEKARGAS